MKSVRQAGDWSGCSGAGGRQLCGMARAQDLALQLQQALESDRASIDSIPSAATVAAGVALFRAVSEASPAASGEASVGRQRLDSVLEPIILRTTLATSIVAHLEAIPWAAVTPRMLSEPAGSPLRVLETVTRLLLCFCNNAVVAAEEGSTALASALLRQVNGRPPPVPLSHP